MKLVYIPKTLTYLIKNKVVGIVLLFFLVGCDTCEENPCEGCVEQRDVAVVTLTELDSIVIQKISLPQDSVLSTEILFLVNQEITLDRLSDIDGVDTLGYKLHYLTAAIGDTINLSNLAISYSSNTNNCCSCTIVRVDSVSNNSNTIQTADLPIIF